MFHASQTQNRRAPSRKDGLAEIRKHIAVAMIGRAVKLFVDAQTVTRGIVTGVFASRAGTPKIVVDGGRYDLSQILTITPPYLN